MVTFHQVFVSSHCKSFYSLDQIKSNCMYWLHWKSEKNKTEPNVKDELKCSKLLNQTTSYTYWHIFLYLHADIKTFIYLSQKLRKTELNELKYLKIPLQISSYAHWHVFLYLLALTCIKISIHLSHLKYKKKQNELNKLNELECTKTPS